MLTSIRLFCDSPSVMEIPKSDSSLSIRNHIEAVLKVKCSSVEGKSSLYIQRFHGKGLGMVKWKDVPTCGRGCGTR